MVKKEEGPFRGSNDLKALMEAVPAAIWIAYDPECRVIIGNETANRFYEARVGENVSAGPSSGDEWDRTRRFFRDGVELSPNELPMQLAAAMGQEIRDVELEVLLPSGRWMCMFGSSIPLFGADGKVQGAVASFVDITERKWTEHALAESEKTLRSFFESPGILRGIVEVVGWSDLLHIKDNAEAAIYYGRNPGDLDGKKNSELDLPSDSTKIWLDNLWLCHMTGKPVRFDLPDWREDKVSWLVVTVSPLGIGDSSRHRFTYVAIDDTARRQAERARLESDAHRAFMLTLSDALRPLKDPMEIWEVASRILGEQLGVNRVTHGEVTDDDKYTVFEKNHIIRGVPEVGGCNSMADHGPRLLAELSKGHAIVVNDISSTTDLSDSERADYSSLGIRALIGVPLNRSGRFTAELVVLSGEPRKWTPCEVSLVEETAERTWGAVERARAEGSLAAERRRLFDVLDMLPPMVCLLTPDHRIAFANRAFREGFGELDGRPCYQQCYGQSEPCSFCESFRALETGQPHNWVVRCPDGRVLDAYDMPFTDADGSPMVLEMDIDITEKNRAEEALQDSEERFRTMAENISQLAWMADSTGWMFWFNKRWYDYTGATYDEAKGWEWLTILHPDHSKRVTEKLSECFRAGQFWEDTFPLRSKEGRYRWFLSRAVPVKDEGGRVNLWFGTNTDINDVLEARRALARSNEELRQFAYVASHDLQEPIRMILSYLALLNKKHGAELSPEAQKYLSVANDGAWRMRELIDDLLQYTRVDSSEDKRHEVDLAQVAQKVVHDLHVAINEAKGEVVIGPLPVITADETQMKQLLQNLVSNAIKFHGKERPRVQLSAERRSGEWVISVKDNGIGIDPKHKDKLFQMFQRLHTRDEYPGTGIGLAIAKKIVERHNGRIWVESKAGEGSTFYFTIPG